MKFIGTMMTMFILWLAAATIILDGCKSTRKVVKEDHLQMGILLMQKEVYMNAIDQFDIVISESPKDTRAYFLKGKSYLKQHKSELAKKMFDDVIKMGDKSAEVYYQLAIALNQIGGYGKDVKKNLKTASDLGHIEAGKMLKTLK